MKNIYVTKPFLPPINDFVECLEDIWKSGVLTNYGPYHQKLEIALKNYLEIPDIGLVNNGTMALLAALEVLDIDGEVITTPYSFVATSHALIWRRCRPVFVDISADDCNIDPSLVQDAITERTSAILAVHCYGFPCDVEKLENIAKDNNLKLIYDAAHAFGVKYKGQSILKYGDAAVLSFHATKIFSTVEGGGVVFRDQENFKKTRALSNFGFENEVSVNSVGLNFKLNEIQAAMGMVQIPYLADIFKIRKEIAKRYDDAFEGVCALTRPLPRVGSCVNNSYYPVFVNSKSGKSRDGLFGELRKNSVHCRRYFYPLISEFDAYKEIIDKSKIFVPVAKKVSESVLCLPIYPDLSKEDQGLIIDLILKYFNE